MPKISVIMPVYNAEKYLRDAIDSILCQTFTDFEFIIIDDGSSDSSPNIVLSYDDSRIRFYINDHNMGVAATLNRGLELSTGEYIARMDSDDISMPERLKTQLEYLEMHQQVGVCGSCILAFDAENERLFSYSESNKQIQADLLFNPPFAHPSVMMRGEAARRLKYDLSYEKAEDYDLWYRFLKEYEGHNIQQPMLRYRHHNLQVTKQNNREMNNAVKRIHERTFVDKKIALTDSEKSVFYSICAGVRNLSQSEYESFISGSKKILAAYTIGKKELKKTFSAINLAVKRESELENTAVISPAEYVQKLKNTVKRMLR